MKKEKISSFDENKLQDLSFITGGITDYNDLTAEELASVVFEEEGASFAKPFGRTTYPYYPNWPNTNPSIPRTDFAVFGITIKFNS